MSIFRGTRVAELSDFIVSAFMLVAAADAGDAARTVLECTVGRALLGIKLAVIVWLLGSGAYASVLGIYLSSQPNHLLDLLERLYALSKQDWPRSHENAWKVIEVVQLVIVLGGYAMTGATLGMLRVWLRGLYGVVTGERPWIQSALGTGVALGGIYLLLSNHSWIDLVVFYWQTFRYCTTTFIKIFFWSCLKLWDIFEICLMWMLRSLGYFQDCLSAIGSQDGGYEYKRLDTNQIRLLKLSRCFPGSRIHASLVNVSIMDLPAYEGISYVWGDATATHSIIIENFEFPVSEKVYEILHEKSSTLTTRLLWIDWICINQADLGERGQQVGLMRQIYGKASRVTVCLGSPPDANMARWLLFYLHFSFLFDRCSNTETLVTQYIRDRATSGDALPENWAALYRLFNNPWFERVWVVQEAVVASKLSVLYGGHYIRWNLLPVVLEAFQRPDSGVIRTLLLRNEKGQADALPLALENGTLMEAFRSHRIKNTLSFPRVLRSCHSFRAKDPRDKVFALQGITDAALDASLPIDYEMDTVQVFMNTARYFLRTRQLLEVLPLAGIGWKSLDGIPSWVVDWTMRRAPSSIAPIKGKSPRKTYNATLESVSHIIPGRNDRSILIRCIDFDSIAQLSSVWGVKSESRVAERSTLDFSTEAQEIMIRYAPRDLYHTGQSLSEAFWRTLICDRFEQERPVPKIIWEERFKNLKEMAAPLAQFKKGGLDSLQPVSPDQTIEEYKEEIVRKGSGSFQFHIAMAVCLERRFGVTEKGYLAIVPPKTQVGDRVCAVLGAEVPFLFRGASDSTGLKEGDWCCELVGECYVHGLMDGEILGEGYEKKTKMFEVR